MAILKALGKNSSAELGQGSNTPVSSAVALRIPGDWFAVFAGQGSAVALAADGAVWAWGAALGYGAELPRQVLAGQWASLAVGGKWTGGQYGAYAISASRNLHRLYRDAATDTVSATLLDANAWSGMALRSSCSGLLAVRSDGALYAENLVGDFNDANWSVGMGNGYSYPFGRVGLGNDWSYAAGFYGPTSCAVKQDGSMWLTGANHSGIFGDGNTTEYGAGSPTFAPGPAGPWSKAAMGAHMLAIKGGELWAWGLNFRGELGRGTIGGWSSTPTRIGSKSDWVDVAVGSYASYAIDAAGDLYGWGDNTSGNLGYAGDDSAAPVKILSGVLAVSSHAYQTSVYVLTKTSAFWTNFINSRERA